MLGSATACMQMKTQMYKGANSYIVYEKVPFVYTQQAKAFFAVMHSESGSIDNLWYSCSSSDHVAAAEFGSSLLYGKNCPHFSSCCETKD